jgi:hypothetical protein
VFGEPTEQDGEEFVTLNSLQRTLEDLTLRLKSKCVQGGGIMCGSLLPASIELFWRKRSMSSLVTCLKCDTELELHLKDVNIAHEEHRLGHK